MKDIYQYIKESILADDDALDKRVFVKPKNRKELEAIIDKTLNEGAYQEGETVDLNFIDTSKITDLVGLFADPNLRKYNYDISEWNVSKVISMNQMLYGCKYFDCDLSKWKTTKLTSIFCAFHSCENFKGKGLKDWYTEGLDNINLAFAGCKTFCEDITGWKLKQSTKDDAKNAFNHCDYLKSHNLLPKWWKEEKIWLSSH